MKRVLVAVCVVGALGLATSEASAGPIVLTPAGTTCTSNDNSNMNSSSVLAQVQSCFGASSTALTMYYKANVGGQDEGTFANAYSTAFTNSKKDPADALISYLSGTAITCPSCYLVVKGGNSPGTVSQYFFNLGTWNGVDALNLLGFWPKKNAISNIAIWGAPLPTAIPEPGTVLLFGTAMVGLWSRNRRRSRQ